MKEKKSLLLKYSEKDQGSGDELKEKKKSAEVTYPQGKVNEDRCNPFRTSSCCNKEGNTYSPYLNDRTSRLWSRWHQGYSGQIASVDVHALIQVG